MIKKMVTAVSAIYIAAFLITANTHASQREINLFDQGYEYYLSYQPEKAVESFHIFLNEFPGSSVKDAALFWLGRSLVTLQRYEEAKQAFLRLKQEIPDSPFKTYVDKELAMMNAQDAEQKTMPAFQLVDSEIQGLKNDKAQAEKTLSEIREERDKLRLLLEEEKMKKKEFEAKADRFDGELRDILARLQALRTNQEDDHSSAMISKVQHGELDPGGQAIKSVITEAVNENGVQKDKVQGIVNKQGKQMEPLHEAQKEHLATQRESSHTLELIASEETWIFVTIDNKETKERLLKPGARIKWSAKSGFALRIGNAGGTKVIFNGKDIGPLGEKGKVVKLNLPSLNLTTNQRELSNVF